MNQPANPQVEAERRAIISNIQSMVALEEQILPEIKNYFGKNVYIREMFMKKDSLVVGKIHKFENVNILSKGKALVLSHEGAKVIEAPCTFVASPGAKRVIVALEDLVWSNVHGTSETDLGKIEAEFIAKGYDEVLSMEELKLLEGALHELGNSRNGGARISNEFDESKRESKSEQTTSGDGCSAS